MVGQVEELVNRAHSTAVADVRYHLELSIKGIVTEKPIPKPAEKPDLNMDDDEMYDGYSSLQGCDLKGLN